VVDAARVWWRSLRRAPGLARAAEAS